MNPRASTRTPCGAESPAKRTEILRLPRLRSYQERVLAATARDVIALSTVQAGKTFLGAVWLLAQAWKGGAGLTWWWCGPTYEQAKLGFNILVRMAESAKLLARPATTQPPLYAVIRNGARIEARSYDMPQNLMGATVAGAVIDEFSALGTDAYGAMSSRRAATIARGLGRYMWLGNAGADVGGPAEQMVRAAESGARGFELFVWTWRDLAEALSCRCGLPLSLEGADDHRLGCERSAYLAFVSRERERLSAGEWDRLFLAKWTEAGDLPVYTFDRSVHVRDDVTLRPTLPLILGCDFNVDPMAWVIGQEHQGEVWFLDEIAIEGGATTEAAAQEFVRRYAEPRREVIVRGDASGHARKTSATSNDYQIIRSLLTPHFRNVRMETRQANPLVPDRVAAVNGLLRSASGVVRLVLSPRCRRTARDLARVSWRPGTREIDKRDRSLTHFSDALGYAITPIHERSRGGGRRVHVWDGVPGVFDGGIAGMQF